MSARNLLRPLEATSGVPQSLPAHRDPLPGPGWAPGTSPAGPPLPAGCPSVGVARPEGSLLPSPTSTSFSLGRHGALRPPCCRGVCSVAGPLCSGHLSTWRHVSSLEQLWAGMAWRPGTAGQEALPWPVFLRVVPVSSQLPSEHTLSVWWRCSVRSPWRRVCPDGRVCMHPAWSAHRAVPARAWTLAAVLCSPCPGPTPALPALSTVLGVGPEVWRSCPGMGSLVSGSGPLVSVVHQIFYFIHLFVYLL